MITCPTVGVEGDADSVEDYVSAVVEEGGVDADYSPAQCFQGCDSVDVLRALGGVGPMVGAVVFDGDAPFVPAHIDPGDEPAAAVADHQLGCGSG